MRATLPSKGGVSMRIFVGYWWWILSAVCTAAALWAGLAGEGPGPRWAWIVGAYVVILIASGIAIFKAEKRAVLFDCLKEKHRQIADEWTALDNLYQNSPRKAGEPKTLPVPMESRQFGDEELRFRIGVLQGRTCTLIDDWLRVGIDIGFARADIRSVPELLRVLERGNR